MAETKVAGLNREEIKLLIEKSKLVENFVDLDLQLTPNGFDLTVAKVYSFEGAGRLDFSNKERVIPAGKEILARKENAVDDYGWWSLTQGVYKVLTNEKVNLPNDLIALAFSRSSLLRMGLYTQHGVWDAGFKGRGEFILSVQNPHGVSLKENSRLAQLVFIRIKKSSIGYNGIFQHK